MTPYLAVDLVIAQRIAEYVALALSHQHLAEQARYNEELRARAEKSDLIDAVLASIASTGELADVFEQISDVTQKVLPHDALLLTELLPNGRQGRVYASKAPTEAAFPEVLEVPPNIRVNRDWEFDIVDDLQADPNQRHLAVAQKGYRAALRVPLRFDDDFVGALSFLSFSPKQYGSADVLVAKRIADRVALCFARERGAVLLKRADEATARAAKLEARVRALTDELDSRTGYRRVVGESPVWRQVLTQATQVASTEATVLLLGESGTGKEVVGRFLHRASSRSLGRPPGGISRDARKMLNEYHWPGNVRELRNILERAAILCDGGLITAEHLALNVVSPLAPVPSMELAAAAVPSGPASVATKPSSADELQLIERDMIDQALQRARFNKSKAAKALGLTRQQLYLRMRKYGLE